MKNLKSLLLSKSLLLILVLFFSSDFLSAQPYCQDCDQPTITTHTVTRPLATLILTCPPDPDISDPNAIIGTVTYQKEVCGDRITYKILNFGLFTSFFNWQGVQGCNAVFYPNPQFNLPLHPSTLPPPYPGSNQTDWDNWYMNMIVALVPELANMQPGHMERIRFKDGCQQLFQSQFPDVTLQLDFGANEGGIQNVDFGSMIGIFPAPCGNFCCEAELNLLTNVISITSVASESCDLTPNPAPVTPPKVRGKDPITGEEIEITATVTSIGPCESKCSTRNIPRLGYSQLTGNNPINKISIKNEVTILPNPVTDRLTIVTPSKIKSSIILNSIGKECLRIDGDVKYLEIGQLEPGIYSISVEMETGIIINQRFVKR